MKRILYTICIGTLALAFTARAADQNNQNSKHNRKATTVSKQSAVQTSGHKGNRHAMSNSGQMKTQRNLNTASSHQRHSNVSKQTNASAKLNGNAHRNNHVRASNQTNVSRHASVNGNQLHNRAMVRHSNGLHNNTNVTVNRQRNVNRNVVVTNNWHGHNFSGQNYWAFRNYHRQWHNRNWWSNNQSRIVIVLGGAYYWNSGYWYPAWGYNPRYSYPYDGPIYGYGNLSPDQVVVNVQAQLQRDGYYNGPVDGVLGRMTRQAIAQFQADNGLAVTSAVDEPTLSSLGLV